MCLCVGGGANGSLGRQPLLGLERELAGELLADSKIGTYMSQEHQCSWRNTWLFVPTEGSLMTLHISSSFPRKWVAKYLNPCATAAAVDCCCRLQNLLLQAPSRIPPSEALRETLVISSSPPAVNETTRQQISLNYTCTTADPPLYSHAHKHRLRGHAYHSISCVVTPTVF